MIQELTQFTAARTLLVIAVNIVSVTTAKRIMKKVARKMILQSFELNTIKPITDKSS